MLDHNFIDTLHIYDNHLYIRKFLFLNKVIMVDLIHQSHRLYIPKS